MERIVDFDLNRGKFITWFFTFVVQLVLNRMRREKMRDNTQRSSAELETVADSVASREIEDLPPECQEVIHRTVDQMPLRLKAIVLGLYFCEPPKMGKDLARELGITPATITQNKNKAMGLLREALVAAGCQP